LRTRKSETKGTTIKIVQKQITTKLLPKKRFCLKTIPEKKYRLTLELRQHYTFEQHTTHIPQVHNFTKQNKTIITTHSRLKNEFFANLSNFWLVSISAQLAN